jgi:hypothetical protein
LPDNMHLWNQLTFATAPPFSSPSGKSSSIHRTTNK